MKRIITAFIVILLTVSGQVCAQTVVDKAIDACIGISAAAREGSTTKMKSSLAALRACDASPLVLRVEGQQGDLDGHMVFDEEYIDSLISNRMVLKEAKRYAKMRNTRGTGASACRIGTYVADPGASLTFKTSGRGQKTVGVVGEPDGMFSMTITDKAKKQLYTDTKDVKKGQNSRRATVTLPEKSATTIYITVTNRGKQAKSFALITN